MLFETPEDTHNAYNRFLRKGEYKKAYRLLEKMLHEFPDDLDLLEEIVELCFLKWERPEMAKPWLIKLANIRSSWLDYMLLSRVEAELENISKTKEFLKKSKELQRIQPKIKSYHPPKKVFTELEGFIKFREWNMSKGSVEGLSPFPQNTADLKVREKEKQETKDLKNKFKESDKKEGIKTAQSFIVKKPVFHIPSYNIPVKIEPLNEEIYSYFLNGSISNLREVQMFIDYTYLTIQSGYDELLCLNAVNDVEKYWYQIETVKKVLKRFRGRVLLCDEVGLGKTIEAGMLIKEYLMRGMIKNVLILTPAPLVSQWREEMQAKFGIDFSTTDDTEFIHNPTNFWKLRFIIASINTAKSSKNMSQVTEQFYDLVVVDEAHHLKNRTTLAWKLVNQMKKKFIFLLTAHLFRIT